MKITLLTAALLLASCSQDRKSDRTTNQNMDSSTISQEKTRTITADQLKTGEGFSTAVISDAQKFIIPVPAFAGHGEPLVYPANDAKAGKTILDYEGKPIGKSGIVFFNYKDKSVQAAAGEGNDVIIINEVKQEQAEKLDAEIKKHQSNPAHLSLKELKEILVFSHEQLGLSDMYNSTRSFVEKKMTPVLADNAIKSQDGVYGFKKRDDRDINQAIYIPGEFVFEGPAATPQKFKDGGVIVEQGGKMRGIQPDIFMRTYQLAKGTHIQSLERDIRSQLP